MSELKFLCSFFASLAPTVVLLEGTALSCGKEMDDDEVKKEKLKSRKIKKRKVDRKIKTTKSLYFKFFLFFLNSLETNRLSASIVRRRTT